MEKLFDDPRPIIAIWFEDDSHFMVREGVVQKIEAYQENGEMAPVAWFAVWIGGKICHKVNSKYIAVVEYEE